MGKEQVSCTVFYYTVAFSIKQYQTAQIDLAKSFKGDDLYHLLHLRYGCPGKDVMRQILQSKRVRGVPTNVTIPDIFRCPICDKEKTNSVPNNPTTDTFLIPKGARFHGDFGFLKINALRGFRCLFMHTEAVTSYRWTLCRRSKHTPIKLLLWFVAYMRKRIGVSFAVLRTDGGGELWNCIDLRNKLLEQHVIMEPTGTSNSAANGKGERSIGVVCVQAQLLLYASGLEPCFWCFSLMYATLLSNIRPKANGDPSSHEVFFNSIPSYARLHIFGAYLYQVNRRLTRRRPESATIACRYLGSYGNSEIDVFINEQTKSLGYSRHHAIDELDLASLP